MASVATKGVTLKRVIAMPQIVPDTSPAPMAAAIQGISAASAPAGNFVTRTAASEMTPATLRSRPPCWMTNVWPIAAMARIDANRAPSASSCPIRCPEQDRTNQIKNDRRRHDQQELLRKCAKQTAHLQRPACVRRCAGRLRAARSIALHSHPSAQFRNAFP